MRGEYCYFYLSLFSFFFLKKIVYQQKFFAVAEENEGLKQDLSALEEDRNHLAGELDSLRYPLSPSLSPHYHSAPSLP